ncbi:hypothetical protein [Kitasatospora sp. NPDC057500]|uniref:hypothetical protein n=1 Tax=Kitasatospora sp. NPDC057500 TaxID=3346151 RepID=UPI0036BEF5BE
MGESRGRSGAKRFGWVRRAVVVFVATFICVLLFLMWADQGENPAPDPGSGSSQGGQPPTSASEGFDFGSAATISAVAGLVTSVGVSASKIISAVAELTRSRADLARARREEGTGAPAPAAAAVAGAGPDSEPGEDA